MPSNVLDWNRLQCAELVTGSRDVLDHALEEAIQTPAVRARFASRAALELHCRFRAGLVGEETPVLRVPTKVLDAALEEAWSSNVELRGGRRAWDHFARGGEGAFAAWARHDADGLCALVRVEPLQ